jgi:hypothetical protein
VATCGEDRGEEGSSEEEGGTGGEEESTGGEEEGTGQEEGSRQAQVDPRIARAMDCRHGNSSHVR